MAQLWHGPISYTDQDASTAREIVNDSSSDTSASFLRDVYARYAGFGKSRNKEGSQQLQSSGFAKLVAEAGLLTKTFNRAYEPSNTRTHIHEMVRGKNMKALMLNPEPLPLPFLALSQ